MTKLKTNKDLRQMLAGALGMIETMLPIVNESFVLSSALKVAVCEMDAATGKKLLDRVKKNMNASTGPVVEPLAIIQDYQRYLNDDSIWKD